MGINTQKFLMLFLVTPEPQTLTLDFAARVIHGVQQAEKTRLTRIRRLYDIANILQSLGLIRKVQVTDGRGKKPAFQFIGPDVTRTVLTEEEKAAMPATRQKNSLLAMGRNLALLPDKESAVGPVKRARSEERPASQPAKLVRTRSESRVPAEQPPAPPRSLFDLGAVCEQERRKLGGGPVEAEEGAAQLMKPPTPGRPPSRKKHLLQRYYSDSALLGSVASPAPAPVPQSPLARVPQSPRPNYSPHQPSPLTKSSPKPPIRSPVTPRDLRNSSILPPHSPGRPKLLTCSPMGPVGRSLLSSPASPRAPMDLSTRPARLGRSPLASRSLNLPPSPPPARAAPGPGPTGQQGSPLLRAYLANSKSATRLFQPILPGEEEGGVAALPGSSSLLSSPASTAAASPTSTSPDGSSASSSASELEGIFGTAAMSRPAVPVRRPEPEPLSFSGLLATPPPPYSTSQASSPFSILSLTSPFLNTPQFELRTPVLSTPSITITKYDEVRSQHITFILSSHFYYFQ